MSAMQADGGHDAHDAIALEQLATMWAGVYKDVEFKGGIYCATYSYDESVKLAADTLAGLDSLIRAHWSRASLGGGLGGAR